MPGATFQARLQSAVDLRQFGIVFAVGALTVLGGPAAAQTPTGRGEARAIIYGGDREFPPYEYLDDTGTPQGFNI